MGDHGQIAFIIQFQLVNGAPTRTRTADLLITNQLLYQLSYRGTPGLIPGSGGRGKPLSWGFPPKELLGAGGLVSGGLTPGTCHEQHGRQPNQTHQKGGG